MNPDTSTTSEGADGLAPQRRLLVISFHYPPDGAVGGMRWAGLSKYLARLGWEVHVLTASAAAADTNIPGVVPKVRKRRHILNDWYNRLSARYKLSAESEVVIGGGAAESGPQRRSVVRLAAIAIRETGGTWLMFPDYARGWVFRAARAARKLLRERHFDAVITSGPPHSVHIAGILATLGRRDTYWIDMRDPWHNEPHKEAVVAPDSWLMRALLPRLERFVFDHVRNVIVNTAEFAQFLSRAEPQLAVNYIPNGIDLEQLPIRNEHRFDGCSIAYVGTLYAGRSLTAVLAAMRALKADNPSTAASLKLRIAGHLDPAHKQQLQADLADGGITDNVQYYGVTPRAQALDLLIRSQLALVLAQDQAAQIPAKLYECVGLGVPTLVIAEPDSASAKEARRIGALTADVNDVAAIRAVFEDALSGRLPATLVAKAPISYEDLAVEMDRLLTRGGSPRR